MTPRSLAIDDGFNDGPFGGPEFIGGPEFTVIEQFPVPAAPALDAPMPFPTATPAPAP